MWDRSTTLAPRIPEDGVRTTNRRHEPRKRPLQDRSRATVDAILIAAAQVFDADGYLGATTDRIAERAGVSVGSLYQYFPNKDALLVALFERHLDEIDPAFAAIESALAARTDLPTVARDMVRSLFALHRGHPELHRVLLEDAPLPDRLMARYHALQTRLCGAWVDYLGPRDDPEAMALMVVSLVEAMAHRFVLYPAPLSRPAEAFEAETAAMLVAYISG